MVLQKILRRTCIGSGATLLSLMEVQWVFLRQYNSEMDVLEED